MKYNPALDGLRALAVLAVLCHHTQAPFARGGFIGVDLFFVLSGYLITQSLAENGTLSRFYLRRARRLIPALAFMLAGFLAFTAITGHAEVKQSALAFFYLSDYGYAFWGQPEGLAHTWSLAVEEHFYLLWPLVFLRFRPSVKALLVAYVIATAWRWGWPSWQEAYFRFDTRLSGLILGCALAFAPRIRLHAGYGLAILAVLCGLLVSGSRIAQGPGIMLAELAAAVAIMGRAPEWLAHPALTYLGRISYGVYLWHYPIARLVRGMDWTTGTLLTLALSLMAAAISYHTIEALWRKRSNDLVNLEVAPNR